MSGSRLMLPILVLALLAGAGPRPSAARRTRCDAAALATDPVYVDPDAERAIGAQADADRIRSASSARDAGPMYIAILPDSAKQAAGGSAQGVAREIQRRLDRPGTYAVLVGDSLRAGSTDVSGHRRRPPPRSRRNEGET